MKKKYIMTLALGLLCLAGYAQQSPTPEMLYGSWVFNEPVSIDRMEAAQQSPGLQQHVSSFYSGRQMHFAENGSFYITFSNGMRFDGQWNLQGDQLFTITNDGAQATQRIVFSNDQNFYLISQNYTNPEAKLLFAEVHFVRN